MNDLQTRFNVLSISFFRPFRSVEAVYRKIITHHIDITKMFLLNLPVFGVFPVEAV